MSELNDWLSDRLGPASRCVPTRRRHLLHERPIVSEPHSGGRIVPVSTHEVLVRDTGLVGVFEVVLGGEGPSGLDVVPAREPESRCPEQSRS